MLLVDLPQAGRLPFREGGGQCEAPNSVEVNSGGQKVNKLELEEIKQLMHDGLEDRGGNSVGEGGCAWLCSSKAGLTASAWAFVITSFTSLIAEQPQVANYWKTMPAAKRS